MTTTTPSKPPVPADAYPASSVGFDLFGLIFLLVFQIGGYVDGWAHNTLAVVETFFTPWHAILYAGFALSALYILIPLFRNRAKGYAWTHAVPKGYFVSVIGIIIFGVFGFCDMIWHIVFGVEANIDAFMSPPHLGLFTGSLLMISGPVCALVSRNDSDKRSWSKNAPAVLAMLTFFLSFTFLLQPWVAIGTSDAASVTGPASARWTSAVTEAAKAPYRIGTSDIVGLHALDTTAKEQPANSNILIVYLHRIGVATIMLYTIIFMGIFLYLLALGRVPVGSFTVLFTIDVAFVSIMRSSWLAPGLVGAQIVVGLASGIAADLLYTWLKPTLDSKRALYLFSFFTPAIFFIFYFIEVQLNGGIWWSEHMVVGSIIYAGAVGLLMAALTSAGYSANRAR